MAINKQILTRKMKTMSKTIKSIKILKQHSYIIYVYLSKSNFISVYKHISYTKIY